MRGITESTPAARSFSTSSDASLLVAAVSEGWAAIVSTTGCTPMRLRSGSRYWLRASWSLARSPAMIPTLRLPPSSPAPWPHWTTACRMDASSGPVHHR